MGVNRPRAACRRRRWSVRSIQVTIAIRSSSQVIRQLAHGRAGSSLFPGGPDFRFACDRCAAARRRTSFSCSRSRLRRRSSRSSTFSTDVVPGLLPSSTSAFFIQPVQAGRRDPEVLGDPLDRDGVITVPGTPDHVVAKLLGIRLPHRAHPPSGTSRHHRSDVNYPCSRPGLRQIYVILRQSKIHEPLADQVTEISDKRGGGLCRQGEPDSSRSPCPRLRFERRNTPSNVGITLHVADSPSRQKSNTHPRGRPRLTSCHLATSAPGERERVTAVAQRPLVR